MGSRSPAESRHCARRQSLSFGHHVGEAFTLYCLGPPNVADRWRRSVHLRSCGFVLPAGSAVYSTHPRPAKLYLSNSGSRDSRIWCVVRGPYGKACESISYGARCQDELRNLCFFSEIIAHPAKREWPGCADWAGVHPRGAVDDVAYYAQLAVPALAVCGRTARRPML